MERLAAKKRKGILSRMPKESNEDILVGLKKAEIKSREEGKRKATAADAESVREELELANAQDKLDARKPAGKLKERPDIKLEGLKSSTDIVQEAKKKEADTGDLATRQNIMREHRREEALQNPESLTPAVREAMQEHMKEEGDRYRAALQPKKGFEAQYDADVKFQEEEYGGGSIRREIEMDEILGDLDPETDQRGYRYAKDRKDVEGGSRGKLSEEIGGMGEDPVEYKEQYARLQKENPNMSKTELQDAAIKDVRAKQAKDAESAANRFKPITDEDDMENEVRRRRLAEEAEAEAAKKKQTDIAKAAAEKAKETGPGGAGTRKQRTDRERAAQKALSYDSETGTFSRDGRAIPQAKVIEDSVDETTTDEIVDEAVTESASQKLFNTYSDRQKASILSQPGGSNFSEALENLSEGNLQGFNEAVKGGGYKEFRVPQGKRFRVEKRFIPALNDFLERVPPDLKASVVQQLDQKVSEKGPDILEGLKGPVEQTLYDQVSDMKGVPTPEDETVIKEFTEMFANHYFNAEPNQAARFGKGVQQTRIIRDFMEALGASPTWGQSLKGTYVSPGIGLASDIFANNPTLFNDLIEFQKSRLLLQGISPSIQESPHEGIIAASVKDTTPEIPVAEGASAPTAARTEGSIEDSPVEDLIASSAGE